MAFMKPTAELMTCYHIDNGESHIVPDDVFDLDDYLKDDGKTIEVCKQSGWYGRLSASGYMDCTEWEGPYSTEQEALNAVQESFEVDAEGEMVE